MRWIMLFSIAWFITACSPVSYETEQTVPYCEVSGSVWYIVGDRNNLEEFIFYPDSVIIWVYTYSPHEQVDQRTGTVYPKYQVMSIIKRKLEILDKNIPYRDGDGELILLQYYRGYTVADNGARPYDWSTYSWIFFVEVNEKTMWMGMYDEFKEVQNAWEFHSAPPIELKFDGW